MYFLIAAKIGVWKVSVKIDVLKKDKKYDWHIFYLGQLSEMVQQKLANHNHASLLLSDLIGSKFVVQ